MTTVVVGTNRFVDCDRMFVIGGEALLRITGNPINVSLTTPEGDTRFRHIQIVNNAIAAGAESRVETTTSSVAVFYKDQLLISAIQTNEDTVLATLDFRPLGLKLFADASALCVGSAKFVKNTFVGGTAINLT